MTLRLSAPSKTFLVGEYAVLRGGRALVLGTEPRFELVIRSSVNATSPWPSGSPTERLWAAQEPSWRSQWQCEFVDPHQGAGGFGASGAQFLLASAAIRFLKSSAQAAAKGLELDQIWQDHQAVTGGREGSGVDLLAQAVGRVARVDRETVSAQSGTWPYPDLAWAIVRTGSKVTTHAHLRDLDLNTLPALVELANEAVNAFGDTSALEFARHVQNYAQALQELGLQTQSTRDRLVTLKAEPWCWASKGCGAMGADTILMLFSPHDRAQVARWTQTHGLSLVADDRQLSHGVDMNWPVSP